MGNTRKCMEQAVLFCVHKHLESAYTKKREGGNHAGNQGGRFIEDFPN